MSVWSRPSLFEELILKDVVAGADVLALVLLLLQPASPLVLLFVLQLNNSIAEGVSLCTIREQKGSLLVWTAKRKAVGGARTSNECGTGRNLVHADLVLVHLIFACPCHVSLAWVWGCAG